MEAKPLPDSPDDISTFYIQATESIQERWPRTLKQGDTFALFDALGDCVAPGLTPGGLFHNDTRHLSGLQLLIDGQRPLLLSSAVENDNVVLTVDLSNPDIYQGNAIVLPRETLHVRRSKFLWQGTCHERIAIHNFDAKPQSCWLTFNFAADFADLFEIRGMQRAKRGEITCGGDRRRQDHLPLCGPGQDRAPQRDRIRSAAAAAVQEPGALCAGAGAGRAVSPWS